MSRQKRDKDQRIVNEQMRRLHEVISKVGWAVQGVLTSEWDPDPEPNFAYTVGMTDAGLPELFVIGSMHPEILQNILNNGVRHHLAKEIVAGDVLDDVAESPVDGSPVLFHVREATVDSHVQQALNYYRDPENRLGRVRLLQLLWPDAKGAYPGSFVYDAAMVQPLI